MAKRGDGFRGLIERVIQDRSFTLIEPHAREVYRPDDGQLSLWDYYQNAVSSSHVGLFFELFSLGVYGGELVDSVSPSLASDSTLSSFPRVDIVDIPCKRARECKGCFYGKELILRDEQVANYNQCQSDHPDYRLLFEIYKHTVPKIRSFPGDEQALHKTLAEHLGYSLRFDYLLLRDLASRALDQDTTSNGRRLVTRALASSYRDSSRLTPTFLNGLFERPEEIIESLGVPLEDILFERLMIPKGIAISSLPYSQLSVLNGKAVDYLSVIPALPVMSIQYKDYDRARSDFLEDDSTSSRRRPKPPVQTPLEDIPF